MIAKRLGSVARGDLQRRPQPVLSNADVNTGNQEFFFSKLESDWMTDK